VADVYEAIELLTNRFPDITESPFGVRARSGSNEFLIRGAINAHDVAVDLVWSVILVDRRFLFLLLLFKKQKQNKLLLFFFLLWIVS